MTPTAWSGWWPGQDAAAIASGAPRPDARERAEEEREALAGI